MNVSSPSTTPTQQTDRIPIVDVLRGFALFGILFVNMLTFSRPFETFSLPIDPATPWFDRAAEWLILFLGEGKFYAMFSMLFGLGFVLQMARIQSHDGSFAPLYRRRLCVLLSIGILHAFLLWVGDILILYAFVGFLLLLFRKAKPRKLLVWVMILNILPLTFIVGLTMLVEFNTSISQIGYDKIQIIADLRTDAARAYHVYANGNFAEITLHRINEFFSMVIASYLIMGFNVMAMFLLGVYFGKREVFRNLDANRNLFQKLLAWGLLIGLSGSVLYASLIHSTSHTKPTWPALLLSSFGHALGAPFLMLAYVSALCLLALSPSWDKRIAVLAPVGQMALTNYLAQSVVCTLVFYGYGLGLYGKMGSGMGICLTIVIFLLQIPFSHWWMKNFHYEPIEWLWRTLTYRKFHPFKRLG